MPEQLPGILFLATGIGFVALCWWTGRANDRARRGQLGR